MSLQFESLIGSGSYSDVYRATDDDGSVKAVKVCYKDGEANGCHCARELDITNRCGKQGGAIQIKRITQRSPTIGNRTNEIDHLHFIMDKGREDLSQFIRNSNSTRYWSNLRSIMIELLSCISFVHHRKIIHRDLKPDNVIIFDVEEFPLKVSAKITDFGIAKLSTCQRPNSPQAVTISHRAPEIAMGIPYYGTNSDIWSLGLMFYNMARRDPTGATYYSTNENDLLQRIVHWYPIPSKARLEELFQSATAVKWEQISIPKTSPTLKLQVSCKKLFEEHVGDPELFLDLITHMMDFDWNTRFSAEDCFRHPFFVEGRQQLSTLRPLLTPFSRVIEYTNYAERAELKDYIQLGIESIMGVEGPCSDGNLMTVHILAELAILVDRYYSSPEATSKKYPFELVLSTLHYLVLKYYNVLTPIPSIDQYFQRTFSDDELQQMNEFELDFICDICEGRFYVDTMIDYAPRRLSVQECRDIIFRYLDDESLKGTTHEQALKSILHI